MPARPRKDTAETAPIVDDEDGDRRAYMKRVADMDPLERAALALNPQLGEPLTLTDTGSAEEDEHRGLAKRILDLKRALDEQRKAFERSLADVRQVTAQVEQVAASVRRDVDAMMKEWERRGRDLQAIQAEAGEQVRAAGEQVRKLKDELQALEELRETAADPHEVVKPLRKDIGQLKHDLQLLNSQVDRRFEALPKDKSKPWELRGDDEDPFMKLGREIAALRKRVDALS